MTLYYNKKIIKNKNIDVNIVIKYIKIQHKLIVK